MTRDLFSVKGKVMVVTGGLGQLGRRFSLALAERGARVAVFDVDVTARRVAQRFGAQRRNPRLLFVPVDVTKRASIETGLRRVTRRWGVPHGLINNAALDAPPHASPEDNGPFERYRERTWDQVMAVNLKGVFLCSQVIGAQMAKAGRGVILNISSVYGMVSPDQRIYDYRRRKGEVFFKPAAYAASKAALLNLTRYLATYWAGRNVRVNTLTFGGVFNHQDERLLQAYCARVPLGRMAQEEELNGAVIFSMSDASSYMTGSNLVMDGGWTAW